MAHGPNQSTGSSIYELKIGKGLKCAIETEYPREKFFLQELLWVLLRISSDTLVKRGSRAEGHYRLQAEHLHNRPVRSLASSLSLPKTYKI